MEPASPYVLKKYLMRMQTVGCLQVKGMASLAELLSRLEYTRSNKQSPDSFSTTELGLVRVSGYRKRGSDESFHEIALRFSAEKAGLVHLLGHQGLHYGLQLPCPKARVPGLEHLGDLVLHDCCYLSSGSHLWPNDSSKQATSRPQAIRLAIIEDRFRRVLQPGRLARG